TQLLGSINIAQSLNNPVPANGGAAGESLSSVSRRGPQVMRHEARSLAALDYEALALEASPGVALAKALPAIAPNLRPAPGWVTIIIVPHSADAQPQPSRELRDEVQAFLAARAPATLAPARLNIIGPSYLPV